MNRKLRVGVLFGGRSGEHDVSLVSAASVMEALDRTKYEVVPIGITQEGQWRLCEQAVELLPKTIESGRPVSPSADPSAPQFLTASRASAAASGAKLDVIFPVLHGTFGEDGTVQGLFELANIPYVGAGVLASATGMDKDVMKRLFRDAGLPVVPWILVLRAEWEDDARGVEKRIEEFGLPVFVKPANLGSSVGISKVTHRKDLAAALQLAAQYDRKIVVEEAVDAREIECAVLGNDHPEASVPGEIIPINEFYDYEAKYVKEGSKIVIPAKLSSHIGRRIQKLAIRAFQALDCAGMGRVDFLLRRGRVKVYVNEINTIPGFTPISMYPKMWKASGLPYPQLLDRLIELALERHADKMRTSFQYAVLTAKTSSQ